MRRRQRGFIEVFILGLPATVAILAVLLALSAASAADEQRFGGSLCAIACSLLPTHGCCTVYLRDGADLPALPPRALEALAKSVRKRGREDARLENIRRMDLGDFWKRPLRRGSRDHLGDFWKRPFPPGWREAADRWRGMQALDSEGR